MGLPSTPDVGSAWATLVKARSQIVDRIRSARVVSDREVYEVGQCVSAIVQQATSYVNKIKTSLRASSESTDTALVDEIRSNVMRQERLIAKALESAHTAIQVARSIEGASRASRLLALNARVESSRLEGAVGSAFDVIADEVRSLSDQIDQANVQVTSLMRDLHDRLPLVAEEAKAASQLVETLYETQARRQAALRADFEKSNRAGEAIVQEVLSKAREALSHLQFQDPMIQDIEAIDRVLTTALNRAAQSLGHEETVQSEFAPILSETLGEHVLEDDAPSAADLGEALLF